MSRKSPYVIALSEWERGDIEGLVRKNTSSHREVVRAKIVLLAATGLPNDEIARKLYTSRQIVSKWRKRFFQEGLAGLKEQPRRS